MKKVFLILILNSGILFAQSASFDPSIQIESQLDTTSFKIGEKIDYSIKISLKNKYDIKFSEKPNFLPFEVLESFETDTINDTDKFSIIKKYSLINFEPGEFWIPPQKILFDTAIKFSDSLLITINDVEVPGPPPVKTYISSNVCTPLIDASMNTTSRLGIKRGNVILKKVLSLLVPSISAASYKFGGIA